MTQTNVYLRALRAARRAVERALDAARVFGGAAAYMRKARKSGGS